MVFGWFSVGYSRRLGSAALKCYAVGHQLGAGAGDQAIEFKLVLYLFGLTNMGPARMHFGMGPPFKGPIGWMLTNLRSN